MPPGYYISKILIHNKKVEARSNTIKKFKAKVKMLVTDHNSTIKIALLIRKCCKKFSWLLLRLLKPSEK